MPNEPTLATVLAELRAIRALLEAKPAHAPAPAPRQATTGPSTAIEPASDADLDGPYGNPEIRRDPPRWSGETMVGRMYSDCPVAYLETLADFLVWKAGKNASVPDRAKYADYDRRDAARALGWADRNRAPAPLASGPSDGPDDGPDDVPF